ncbi:tuftelin 1b isoform X1 [Clupea harengus]|uniref:Tuftelin 1b isoform X1 n=2 Tax=Clupea harengus TaxID=7950 RepID=A0A6P8GRD7_CLUHA|nr:tuftelin 1b isoform X1 [Clupea harengus]
MNGTAMNECSFHDIRTEDEMVERCGRLKITLQDTNSKPSSESQQRKPESLPPPPQEQTEVIKVYLEKRSQKDQKHRQSVKMLTDEVSQIQEVRYCLKSLRQQMASRHNNNNNNKFPTNGYGVTELSSQSVILNGNVDPPLTREEDDEEDECVRLREVTRRLYAQLQKAERRHQEERDKMQASGEACRQRVEEQAERLQEAEVEANTRRQQVQEQQRLLGCMETENGSLRDKMAAREAELEELRKQKEGGQAEQQRSEQLEKDLAGLKEKVHQLDDMLKSQQRKVRHMIEQLQNSRTVIQERDRHIRDLEEKVAFLEAENREMHDQMEFLLGDQKPQQISPQSPQVVYSKPLTPTRLANKSLPFIKVIEIKS